MPRTGLFIGGRCGAAGYAPRALRRLNRFRWGARISCLTTVKRSARVAGVRPISFTLAEPPMNWPSRRLRGLAVWRPEWCIGAVPPLRLPCDAGFARHGPRASQGGGRRQHGGRHRKRRRRDGARDCRRHHRRAGRRPQRGVGTASKVARERGHRRGRQTQWPNAVRCARISAQDSRRHWPQTRRTPLVDCRHRLLDRQDVHHARDRARACASAVSQQISAPPGRPAF